MKKTFVKLLSLALAFIMAFGAVPLIGLDFGVPAAAAGEELLTFGLSDDEGSYTVTACNTAAAGEIVIPNTYNGKPVEAIGTDAFSSCQSLTSVVIPENVKFIQNNAFNSCDKIKRVTFASGSKLEEIETTAFSTCSALANIRLPENLKTIGAKAFQECVSLESITIPPSVTDMGVRVFLSCIGLKSVYFYSSTITIGSDLFLNCSYLTDVFAVEDARTAIQNATGIAPTAIPSADLTFMLNSDGTEYVVTGDNSPSGYAEIPAEYSGLPVVGIKANAFDSGSLTAVSIPESVTYIGGSAFASCPLHDVFFTGESEVTSIDDATFYHCNKLESINLPKSITALGYSAFDGCDKLKSIYIPDAVEQLGANAFYDCFALESVTFGKGSKLETIGQEAFHTCSLITDIIIPAGVTAIAVGSFSGCEALEEITIPKSVTIISDNVFNNCTALTKIHIPDSVTAIAANAFDGRSESLTIYGIKNSYANTYAKENIITFVPVYVILSPVWNIASFTVGDEYQYTATVSNYHMTSKPIVWTSSNKSVATIDNKGNIKAVGAGAATISASIEGVDKCEREIIVRSPIEGVKLSSKTVSFYIGTTYQLFCIVIPANVMNDNVIWTSSDNSIASVDENGLVTAKAKGNATITVTTVDGRFTDTCEIAVKVPISVTLDIKSKTLDKDGSQQLTATVTPLDASVPTVLWSSSDKAVACVDENGLVTAKSEGTATITATANKGGFGYTDTCEITVFYTVCPHEIWSEWASNDDATFFNNGTKTRTCTRCGETETVTDEGSALWHKCPFICKAVEVLAPVVIPVWNIIAPYVMPVIAPLGKAIYWLFFHCVAK